MQCSQCRKIDAGVHPDVLTIGLEEEASEIKIAQIRSLLQTLGLRPLEGRHKVFIIDPADAMNAAAANALLKGLEEPPEDSYFILLSPSPQSLLMTVRSRCQTYPFVPLTLDEMRRFSQRRTGPALVAREHRYSEDPSTFRRCVQRREVALDFLETAVHAKDDQIQGSDRRQRGYCHARKSEFDSNMNMIAVLLEDLLYISEGLYRTHRQH